MENRNEDLIQIIARHEREIKRLSRPHRHSELQQKLLRPRSLRYRETTASGIAHNTTTTLTFNSVTNNENADIYSTSGTQVEVLIDGVFLCEAGILWGSASTGAHMRMFLRHNNDIMTGQTSMTTGFPVYMNCSKVVAMAAGDTFSVAAYQNTGSSLSMLADDASYRAITYLGDVA